VTGEICHIKAKRPGPRYDLQQTDEQRHAYANLILLCRRHHTIVDAEPDKYTVDLLTDYKYMHERNGSIELTQEDVHLVRRLLNSHLQIVATEEAQVMANSPGATQQRNVTISQNAVGNNNTVVAGDQHVYQKPPRIEHVLEREEGAITPAQRRRVHEWIDTVAVHCGAWASGQSSARTAWFFGMKAQKPQLLKSVGSITATINSWKPSVSG
jgi:hypothetical protein